MFSSSLPLNTNFSSKREALENFVLGPDKREHYFSLHELVIKIDTMIPIDLIPLPVSERKARPDLTIELVDQSQLYFSSHPWDHEGNDQVSVENNISFQRDFVCQKLSTNRYQAIIDAHNSDGIYNLLRHLLPPFLLKKQRLLLHSSCVATSSGEALLFLGHSTYGKTTIAELSAPRLVLSDDMNVIEVSEKNIYATGSQLGGKIAQTAHDSYRVSEIYWLQKSNNYHVEKMSLSRAILTLMASVPSYAQLCQTSSELQSLLRVAASLKTTKILNFPKQKEIWNELDPE